MRKLEVETNHGQVAETIENYYAGLRKCPPEGHPNSRECPQCHGETWRLTQWCVHCGADLFAIDARVSARPVAIRRLKIVGAFFLVSGLAFYAQFHVLPGWRIWLTGVGVASMLIAVAVTRD